MNNNEPHLARYFNNLIKLMAVLSWLVLLLTPSPTKALQWNGDKWGVTFDSTFSYNNAWRIAEQDPDLILAASGDKNYVPGIISSIAKGTHELALKYSFINAFARATYFYDFITMEKGELGDLTKAIAGRSFEMLDLYIGANHSGFSGRFGYQVVNWGESLFYQNGINSANTADLTLLRQPGSELREALTPSPMAWASARIIGDLTVEGFYILQFKHVELDATGTYFSSTDTFGQGDTLPLKIDTGVPLLGVVDVHRRPDVVAKDGGEYGLALRYFATVLNNTEFGLYFMNYHHRAPVIGAYGGHPLGFLGLPGYTPPSAFIEYPEDVQLYGLSFNTDLMGLALSGEVAYRPEYIWQADLEYLVGSAFGPPVPLIGATGETFSGVVKLPVGQYSLVLLQDFASTNPFFADNMRIMAEISGTHLYDTPDEGEVPLFAHSNDIDEFSMGYQASLTLTYYDAIGPITLVPNIAFLHDAWGNSPGGGNFIEGRMSIAVGLEASYLNTIAINIGYTNYFGAEENDYNGTHDRDFVTATLKYFL